MTFSSPDEALHFRGKTLTPESPRPLHVAEPANIPVLQNQMDPIFNDTSTYETPLESTSHPSHHDHMQQSVRAPTAGLHVDMEGNAGPPQDQNQNQNQNPQEPGSFLSGPSPMDGLANMNSAGIFAPTGLSAPLSRPFPSAADSLAARAPENPSLTADAESTSPSEQTVPEDPLSLSSQRIPAVAGLDNTTGHRSPQSSQNDRLDIQHLNAPNSHENGVDFQKLLDNLPPPSAASSAPVVSLATSSASDATVLAAALDDPVQTSLGLPPRPPPQEKPSIHPNYSHSDDIRSYHQLPHTSSTPTSHPSQDSSHLPFIATVPQSASTGAGVLPPPPLPSFQQSPPSDTVLQDHTTQPTRSKDGADLQSEQPLKSADEDIPWGRDVQKKYDEFLHEERVYVTEGLWDRFPAGSRLFVGNLPTERVTKRDLFHIFHKYGRLAQISIKQAYGFIQFLEASSCYRSLQAEQGAVIRGRKIHLEISKPQRNNRAGQPSAESSRAPPSRRSRSPDFARGSGGANSRSTRTQPRLPFSDFRDEPNHRRRTDYRLPRSPSPRSFRGRDDYRLRDRTPDRYDRRERRRSRSPYGRDRRYRSPSPRARGVYEGESDLPVPRRIARDVPEVQILILEEVDRNFILYIENSFRNRGLRVDSLMLGPRIPLNAAIQRQIVEGVLAVVKLSRPCQLSRRVPLQVFDRTGGPDKVRFNEYPEVEPGIAAEIVFHAQSTQRSSAAPTAAFPPAAAFGVSPLVPPPQVPPQQIAGLSGLSSGSSLGSLITSMDGPALQSLLASLQQRPQPIPTAQQPFPALNNSASVTDLASLLNNATRQAAPGSQQHFAPSQHFSTHAPNAPVVPDPNLMALLAKGLGAQQQQGQGNIGAHAQNIVSQYSKWKQ